MADVVKTCAFTNDLISDVQTPSLFEVIKAYYVCLRTSACLIVRASIGETPVIADRFFPLIVLSEG